MGSCCWACSALPLHGLMAQRQSGRMRLNWPATWPRRSVPMRCCGALLQSSWSGSARLSGGLRRGNSSPGVPSRLGRSASALAAMAQL